MLINLKAAAEEIHGGFFISIIDQLYSGMEINLREATIKDIPQLQVIRHAVKENILSDPALVTDEDCKDYITNRGKGWVAETENKIIGFSIVDMQQHNVWALFIHPEYEGMGVGKQLHNIMLDWYFTQTKQTVWLGTEPSTRAEKFYRKCGWKEVGIHGKGEIKFEMDVEEWERKKINAKIKMINPE